MAGNSQKTAKRKRGRGKPFTKGDPRINRDGRPKVVREWREGMRDLSEEAVTVLRAQMHGKNKFVAQGAAKFVIEQGWGKATQPHEHSGPEGQPIQVAARPLGNLTDAELIQLEREARALLGREGEAAPVGDGSGMADAPPVPAAAPDAAPGAVPKPDVP